MSEAVGDVRVMTGAADLAELNFLYQVYTISLYITGSLNRLLILVVNIDSIFGRVNI
jgi:hypothetical protein